MGSATITKLPTAAAFPVPQTRRTSGRYPSGVVSMSRARIERERARLKLEERHRRIAELKRERLILTACIDTLAGVPLDG